MKRIMISGGGTGGHIYPAITLYKNLKNMIDGEFLYVGTEAGLESTIVPKEGIPFTTLPVQGLQRKISLDALVTAGKAMLSLWKANQLLSEFKPHIVIGTGGYVCGPLLFVAACRGIPTLIQEQNVVPGVTNKILSPFVDIVAVGYKEAISEFSHGKKVVYTGNPVRPDMLENRRQEGRHFFGVKENQKVILIAGGSRGARTINRAMVGVHAHFKDRKDIKLIHATGSAEYKSVLQSLGLEENEIYSESSYILPYIDNMSLALGAADMAIFRSGAIGLAELGIRGIPSILIPYPYAAADHQTFNAKVFQDEKAAFVIKDNALDSESLIEGIERIIYNDDVYNEMAAGARRLGKPKAAQDICELALSICP